MKALAEKGTLEIDLIMDLKRVAQPRIYSPRVEALHGDCDLHVMFNLYWDSLEFELPVVPGRRWCLAVDTAQPSLHHIAAPGSEADVLGNTRWSRPEVPSSW